MPAGRSRAATRRPAYDNNGVSAIVTDVTISAKTRMPRVDQTEIPRHADADEGEFAARTEQEAHFHCDRPRQAEQLGQADDDQRFDGDQRGDAGGQQQRIAQQFANVDVHADGEEENAEQQSLERRDGGFDRLAVFGLGQQKAGDEGAERHRQPGLAGYHAGGDDHEQSSGDEQIARPRRHHHVKQRLQQDAAEQDDHGKRDRGLRQRPAEAGEHRAA